MTAPKQGRKAGTPPSRPAGGAGKKRDRGTRGGRPDTPSATSRRRVADAGPAGDGGRAGTGRNGAGASRPTAAPGTGRGRTGAGAGRGDRKPSPSRAVPEPAAVPPGPRVPRWLQWTALVLSLGGLGVSIYLTIVHYTTSVSIACPENSTVNCEKVISSPQSYVFGIPVAVLGLAFFVFMVVVTTPWAWRGNGLFARLGAVTGWARLGSVIVGIIFVLYLVYTEVITLNMTICLWCTAVHLITLALFGLIVFAATAGYGLTKSPSSR